MLKYLPLLLLIAAFGARAEPLPADTRTALSLIIYNQDQALVTDTRQVHMMPGLNSFDITDIPSQIQPETFFIPGRRVGESGFVAAPDSYKKLWTALIGQTVTYETRDSAGGRTREKARISGVYAGQPLLEINGQIILNPDGQILLDRMPPDFHISPVLRATIEAERAENATLHLTYATRGISWSANYILSLAPDGSGSLAANATIQNNSGLDFHAAKITLVAGQPRLPLVEKREQTLSANATVTEQPQSDYHTYRLSNPVTLENEGIKQVPIALRSGIAVEKRYELNGLATPYLSVPSPADAPAAHAVVTLHLRNRTQDGLGLPLPSGSLRVYEGSGNETLLLGEAQIGDVPVEENIDVPLGAAFDVTGRTRQTAYAQIDPHRHRVAFETTLHNQKSLAVTVDLKEFFPGEWHIDRENFPHERPDAGSARWTIELAPHGEEKLAFTATLVTPE
ncbi:MAG TPA: DUF4139 domain-containing protein [Dongiaceae bacterium]|nr:DUF4139 domain-containing protein [Dongiaceae bacterium]